MPIHQLRGSTHLTMQNRAVISATDLYSGYTRRPLAAVMIPMLPCSADLLADKLGKWSLRRVDLLIRLLGFTLIGGVLWGLSELYIFPPLGLMFGRTPNPFFVLPITLHNIDGAIDVTVGVVGCLVAWSLSDYKFSRTR